MSSRGQDSSRIISFSVGPQLAETVEEYDEKVRDAEVYYFTTTIDAIGEVEENQYKHWSLVFKFKDGVIRVVEAFNYQKMLKGHITKESPPYVGVASLLGTVKTSPKILQTAAGSPDLNNWRYDLTLKNCQEWIKEFLKKLEFTEIWECLNDKDRTFREAKPVLARTLSVSKFFSESLIEVVNKKREESANKA